MSVVFLFPGQGSQCPGMLHALPDHPVVQATLNEAGEALGEDVLSFDDANLLRSTSYVQLCMLIAGVATARALLAKGVVPVMAAGHSVGAFAAAVVAGALEFGDALALVKLRGSCMEEAFPSGFGMGVVLGMTERQLLELIEHVKRYAPPDEKVFLANVNARTQIAVAGTIAGIHSVLQAARSAGARKAAMLPVSVPSHCLLLDSVAARLARELGRIEVRQPCLPLAGNRKARLLRTAEAVREDLALGVAHPVRWHDATTLLYELGARLFVEMSPGRVLTDLVKQSFPEARSVAICESGVSIPFR